MAWSTSTRKARQRGAGTSGWDEQRAAQRILERDGHRCHFQLPGICIGHATEADHIIPLFITGPDGDNDDNKAAICSPCHKAKTIAERPRPATIRRPAERHPGLQ